MRIAWKAWTRAAFDCGSCIGPSRRMLPKSGSVSERRVNSVWKYSVSLLMLLSPRHGDRNYKRGSNTLHISSPIVQLSMVKRFGRRTRRFSSERQTRNSLVPPSGNAQESAATRIQALVRMTQARKRYVLYSRIVGPVAINVPGDSNY